MQLGVIIVVIIINDFRYTYKFEMISNIFKKKSFW